MFAARASRVYFVQVSKSDRKFWHRVCSAAGRKNSSNGLITKSVESAELLILLASVLSYFLETPQSFVHREGVGTNLRAHVGVN